MVERSFWQKKRVFLTGHTGFKGAWLAIWLNELGAEVFGYALEPPTEPSIFESAHLDKKIHSVIGNINDVNRLRAAFDESQADIVFHLAAQPLVRESYNDPLKTFEDNVLGTAKVLDLLRGSKVKSAVFITTDKCYENKEWYWGYRENDVLGGYDPYSASKACAELVVSSYRNSYFNASEYGKGHSTAIATARAGNVIGGGDWAMDRLIPDIVRSIEKKEKVIIRNPGAIRPWQHVLEPLHGYLLLAQRLYEDGVQFAEAWNFGPDDSDARSVSWIVECMMALWPDSPGFKIDSGLHPHEAGYLKLDCSKTRAKLGWMPTWDLQIALSKIIEWYFGKEEGTPIETLCVEQIKDFMDRNST